VDQSKQLLNVGFIGIGKMGGPIAKHLLEAGYPLVVNDINQGLAKHLFAMGAEWGGTPKEVAKRSRLIFTCLPSLDAIKTVFLDSDGLAQHIRRGTILVEMSTNSHQLLLKIEKAIVSRGGHLLDAPISGGVKGCEQKKLAVWVGGNENLYRIIEPVLKCFSDRPRFVGALGAGLTTKLVHNCSSQVMQAGFIEAFLMGVKKGLDPLLLWAAIRDGSVGRRRTYDGLADEVLPRFFDKASVDLSVVAKDLSVAIETGIEMEMSMPFAELAMADIQEAIKRGWSKRDARVVSLISQEKCGVEVKVDPGLIQQCFKNDPPCYCDTKHNVDRKSDSKERC